MNYINLKLIWSGENKVKSHVAPPSPQKSKRSYSYSHESPCCDYGNSFFAGKSIVSVIRMDQDFLFHNC